MALISGMESAWSPKLTGILMGKNSKLFFKSINLTLMSFILLNSCGYKKKEHKIPYEQMPLEISDEANAETKALAAEFKLAYQPKILDQLVDNLFIQERSKLEAQNLNIDPQIEEKNKNNSLQKGSIKEFSKELILKLKSNSLENLKLSLEKYIQSEVEKTDLPLSFSKEANSAFNPIVNKTSNSYAFTKLLILVWAQLYPQKDIRAQKLAVIVTPNSINLGTVVVDSAQGPLLFAFNSTATGIQKKYYGPTKSLSGTIAVVDLESYIILSAFHPYIRNLADARSFVMNHSAKKFEYSLNKLALNFKENKSNPLDIEGDSEKMPEEGDPYPESSLSFLGNFSELGQNGLENSHKTHMAAIQQAREAQTIALERARLGDNYHLEGKWPHSFGSLENLEKFIRDQVVAGSTNVQADKIKIITLVRDRSCYSEELAEDQESNEYLENWGISNPEETWHFEEIASDKLAICRALIPMGGLSSGYIKRHTRILQPVYILAPANPENLDEPSFQSKKKEIKDAQRKEIALIIEKYCARLGMKRLESQSEVTQSLQVRSLWKELFHSDAQSIEKTQSEPLKTHNQFEARCVYSPVAAATPPTPSPAPSETDEAKKKREDEEAKKRAEELRLRNNGAQTIRQQPVSITR